MQVVGRPTPRVEGELKVTGKAQYSADLKLPNMLWGRCLRGPRVQDSQLHRYTAAQDRGHGVRAGGPGAVQQFGHRETGQCAGGGGANAVACGVRITDLKMDEMEAERFEFTCFLHSTRHAV